MSEKVTLEDWNTWHYLFDNKITVIEIPADLEVKDYGLFEVVSKTSNDMFTISLKVKPYTNTSPVDIREWYLYYTKYENNNLTTYRSKLLNLTYGDYCFEYKKKNVPCYLLLDGKGLGLIGQYPSAVYPYASKYYLFNGDDGADRKFRLITQYQSQKINNKEFIEVVDDEHKYCSLKLAIEDRELVNQIGNGIVLFGLTKSLYEPPLITIKEPLYLGCNNDLSSKFNSPIDFEVYINNKQYNNYNLPVDYERDYLLVNVKSKSEYPYLPLNKKYQVPVEYKFAENKSELNQHEYIKLKDDMTSFDLTFEGFDNTIDLNKHVMLKGVVTNNKKTTFKDGTIQSCIIVNNDDFTFEDITFNGNSNKIVNNGTLTINECLVNYLNIINNGELNIINSELDLSATTLDLPFIHNIGKYFIENNKVNVTGAFTDNNIIFIRGLIDANILLNSNTWDYDVEYTEDETTYNITGNGFVYSNIDDDTIILRNLEVSNV